MNEATPLVINGVLYTSTSMSQVAALDAVTGKTLWTYDPKTYENGTPANIGFVHRGVSYWEDGDDKRVIYATGDGYLIALNAKTGEPIASFGKEGRVDLTKGLRRPIDRSLYACSSPPVICRDVVVIRHQSGAASRDAARRCAWIRRANGRTEVDFSNDSPRG